MSESAVIRNPSVPPAVELRGIGKTFRYEGRPVPALRDVTLQVERGEFVTVVGPSGCGKTTMLNCVAGLEVPTAGQIFMNGEPLAGRRGLAAYMPQRDVLLPWRSVLDNVILGPELAGIPKDRARVEALQLTPKFGLEGFEHAYPSVLSGGMRQRAALLRTVLMHREVLLLDEPFGALDALTRWQMQEWLQGIWDEMEKTVLFITHDVAEAVFLSDRVCVMTPRPGTIALELPIDLPRPRTRAIMRDPAFVAAETTLLDALLGDPSTPD